MLWSYLWVGEIKQIERCIQLSCIIPQKECYDRLTIDMNLGQRNTLCVSYALEIHQLNIFGILY